MYTAILGYAFILSQPAVLLSQILLNFFQHHWDSDDILRVWDKKYLLLGSFDKFGAIVKIIMKIPFNSAIFIFLLVWLCHHLQLPNVNCKPPSPMYLLNKRIIDGP
jgi:hypothetical protein